jgi:hypothetical protein
MNHALIGEPIHIGESLYELTLRLIPENTAEAKALRNFEIQKPSDAEKEQIETYLLLGILGWSVLSIKNQIRNVFKVRATTNL